MGATPGSLRDPDAPISISTLSVALGGLACPLIHSIISNLQGVGSIDTCNGLAIDTKEQIA